MKHPGAAFVIKYFDLIDEFIKVRCCSDELLQDLHKAPITNKSDYRHRVVSELGLQYLQRHLSPVGLVGRGEHPTDAAFADQLTQLIARKLRPGPGLGALPLAPLRFAAYALPNKESYGLTGRQRGVRLLR